MTPLEHADAHERLADLALEPGAQDRIGSPESDPLGAHLASCETCRRDVEAWQRTHARLVEARGPVEDRVDLAHLAGDEPIAAPAEVRVAVLAAVRRAPVAGRSKGAASGTVILPDSAAAPDRAGGPGTVVRLAGRSRPTLRRFLPLVAVLAVLAVGTGFLVDQATRLDRSSRDVASLERVAASLDRVLRDPDHQTVDLRGADGAASGSLSWASRDLVVLTKALQPPPPDRVYRCWIERDGLRSPVGQMWFAGDTAFWNGTLDEWATISFEAGGTFGVSLEPVSGSAGNPAVLVAELPG